MELPETGTRLDIKIWMFSLDFVGHVTTEFLEFPHTVHTLLQRLGIVTILAVVVFVVFLEIAHSDILIVVFLASLFTLLEKKQTLFKML